MSNPPEQDLHGDDCHDYIYLRNLHLSAAIGADAWDRPGKPQPVIFSLRLQRNISRAAASDNVEDTISYGQICKEVASYVRAQNEYTDILAFTAHMYQLALKKDWGGTSLQIRTVLPKGSLRAEGGIAFEAVAELVDREWDFVKSPSQFLVQDLKIACIIGVNIPERVDKQIVVVNLRISEDSSRVDRVPGTHCEHWRGLIWEVVHTVESSSYQTLEALANDIATVSCSRWAVSPITVSVEKPSALAFVDGAGVQITRRFTDRGVV